MKPGDFFLGAIDFLAILVPGLVFIQLQYKIFDYLYTIEQYEGVNWFPIFVMGYVVGYFLFILSEILVEGLHNRLQKLIDLNGDSFLERYFRCFVVQENHRNKLKSPSEGLSLKERNDGYQRAFSRVNLQGGSGITEFVRNAAGYKLFRSLVLVFTFDAVSSLLFGVCEQNLQLYRALASGVIGFAAYRCFVFLRNHTERLAYEFAVLSSPNDAGQVVKS